MDEVDGVKGRLEDELVNVVRFVDEVLVVESAVVDIDPRVERTVVEPEVVELDAAEELGVDDAVEEIETVDAIDAVEEIETVDVIDAVEEIEEVDAVEVESDPTGEVKTVVPNEVETVVAAEELCSVVVEAVVVGAVVDKV
ncbi:unnamed protein product [Nippostrongylus brasiliensis]|uniref:ATPase n=1 Tax=Nippostrongylus brasiliensis TaxID=27835 RepID=A0A0N4YFC6_NIPBR|nr:unnamed protein product [Nippostrongylus brasiliensis]